MRFWIGACLLLSLWPAQSLAQRRGVHADEGFSLLARAPLQQGGPYLSTIVDRFGDPILVVRYPWTVHEKASIEVAALPDDQTQWADIRPLFFFNRLFHGEPKVAIYECLDGASEVPTKAVFQQDMIEYEFLGEANTLGKPAVLVACRTLLPESELSVGRAVFCLLEPWAADRRLLELDLPAGYFAQKCKLRVWFLRDDAVIWTEEVAWPGIGEQTK